MAQKGEIILYTTPDGESKIEVKLEGETVWLTLDQMATLFQRNKSTISRHVKNVLESGELEKEEVVAKNAITTQHGALKGKTQTHLVEFYNLDMIISVGYRVNSYRGVQFRQWAMPNMRSLRNERLTNCLLWRFISSRTLRENGKNLRRKNKH